MACALRIEGRADSDVGLFPVQPDSQSKDVIDSRSAPTLMEVDDTITVRDRMYSLRVCEVIHVTLTMWKPR